MAAISLLLLFAATDARADWTRGVKLGGFSTSDQECVVKKDGMEVCFARGSDGALWHQWRNGPNSFSGWHSLGGQLAEGSKPSCLIAVDGTLICFARGADNGLWHRWLPVGQPWSEWAGLGGQIKSSPKCITPNNYVNVCAAIGMDNALWVRRYESNWRDWQSLGGVFSQGQNPECTSRLPGIVECFMRGDDKALWANWSTNNGNTFNGWGSHGGALTSDPDCVIAKNSAGEQDCYARAADSGFWVRAYRGQWQPWQSMGAGGNFKDKISCVAPNPGSRMCFVSGGDNRVHVNTSMQAGQWTGWTPIEEWTSAKYNGVECLPRDGSAACYFNGSDEALWQIAYEAPKTVGTVDPVVLAGQRVPEINGLLNPFKGVMTIDGGVVLDPTGAEIFAVEGTLSRSKIAAAGPMGFMLANAAGLSARMGFVDPMPVRLSLTRANNELDLALSFKLIDTWMMTPILNPVTKSQFAFKTLFQVLHAKQSLSGGAPSLSIEMTGDTYAKLTFRDPWLHLTPMVEVANDGSVTFGGGITGACGAQPHAGTNPATECRNEWDMLSLKIARANGGLLKLTYDKGAITGIEAAIENGRLGPSNMAINGAVLGDVDLSPGMGAVMELKQGVDIATLLTTVYPFLAVTGTNTPIQMINNFTQTRAIEPGAIAIFAPTGLTVGQYDFKEPTVLVRARTPNANGSFVAVDANFKGDITKILAGDPSGVMKGQAVVDLQVGGLKDLVIGQAGNIPMVGNVLKNSLYSGFNVNFVRFTMVKVSIFGGAGMWLQSAYANITIGGQPKDIYLPLGAFADKTQLAAAIANSIKASLTVFADPQRLIMNIYSASGNYAGIVAFKDGNWIGGNSNISSPMAAAKEGLAWAKTVPGLGDLLLSDTGQMVSKAMVDAGQAVVGVAEAGYNEIKNTAEKVICFGLFC